MKMNWLNRSIRPLDIGCRSYAIYALTKTFTFMISKIWKEC